MFEKGNSIITDDTPVLLACLDFHFFGLTEKMNLKIMGVLIINVIFQ